MQFWSTFLCDWLFITKLQLHWEVNVALQQLSDCSIICYTPLLSICLSFPSPPLFPTPFQSAWQQIHNYPHSRVLVNVKFRWRTFLCRGLSTRAIRGLLHGCIQRLVVETKCFGRSNWELPLEMYPAKNKNAPLLAHALHHCHHMTHAHCDIVTDCLIANGAEEHDWCVAWTL